MVINWAAGISGNFITAANWNPAAVPGPADDAALSAGGTYTVTSSISETVNSLTTAAGATLAVNGGTFTVNNGTGAGANAGTLRVDAGGTLHITGTIAGSGAVVINGGTLDLTGSYFGNVTFTGFGGTFFGDAGNHNFIGDGLANTLDYSAAVTGIQFNRATGSAYNNFGGPISADHFSGIQVFKAGSANDVYLGGPGNNFIDGGAGDNTLDYSAAAHVIINFTTGSAVNGFGGTDVFSRFDIFKGGIGDDTFIGGAGYHLIDGGGGNNTLDYSAATTFVEFNFSTGLAYNNFGGPTVSVDQFSNFDIFNGGSGNDTFIGGPGYHLIDGGGGTNT